MNGTPTEILRANLAFQAVSIPAGRSLIELRYREPGLRLGATISASALVLCLIPFARRRK